MKRRCVVTALGSALLALAVGPPFVTRRAFAAQVFAWGHIVWATGTPAAGLEVRLIRRGSVRAKAFTNQAGNFTFFDIRGNPSDYHLEVFSGQRRLKRVPIPNAPPGQKLPDMVVQ